MKDLMNVFPKGSIVVYDGIPYTVIVSYPWSRAVVLEKANRFFWAYKNEYGTITRPKISARTFYEA